MNAAFYIAAVVAVVATYRVITRLDAVHALLYLVVSFLAVSLMFFLLGAPLIAALEVIIYAGAIMVLFVFVVMMLNLGRRSIEQERQWLAPRIWRGPALLALVLMVELVYVVSRGVPRAVGHAVVGPKEVSLALFGPYFLVVELASLLLLAGLVAAYALGRGASARTSTSTSTSTSNEEKEG